MKSERQERRSGEETVGNEPVRKRHEESDVDGE